MDAITFAAGTVEFLKKHRFLLVMILAGVILLSMPAEKKRTDTTTLQAAAAEETHTVEQRLSELLSKMEGAGKATVLLTEGRGEQLIYQTDESISDTDQRTQTVLVTNTDRTETGLVRQRIPAVYQGAVILCQGADRAEVKLQIVEAVMSATGLTSDKITVLKMK